MLSLGIFVFSALSETGDMMKTARILLYPDEHQQAIMEKCAQIYGEFLLRCLIQKSWDITPEDVPESLCGLSAIQLCRDVRRRIRKTTGKLRSIPHAYCRWGNDYKLIENLLVLPLGKGFETDELTIRCVIRPFQMKLLASQHPETLVLKHMKNHWFAYLHVEGDK
jgi:hypothetical protein